MVRIGVLGLGEAGAAIAADMRAAGVAVCGFDPDPARCPDAPDTAHAVAGADLVLSLTTATEAIAAARAAAATMHPGQVYADANTSSVALKRDLGEIVASTGARFADLALMAPVPGRGVATPAIASGPGAEAAAAILRPCGMPVEVLEGQTVAAAVRKLLRSVAWKGVASVVCEALAAARAAGAEPWMRTEILALPTTADRDAIARREVGSRRHAIRSAHEMGDVAALLRDLDVNPHMSEASRAQLEELSQGA